MELPQCHVGTNGRCSAAGCALVAKPSEETPYSALALAELAQAAGVPDGLFSVITGQPDPIGQTLCASESIRKLSFTGSTTVGRLLAAQCAPSVKRLSLELGGNAPFIVFEDANMDQVISGAMANKFRNCGQTCIASNRFLIHQSRVDEFATQIVEQVRTLNMGHGTQSDVQIGPLINQRGLKKSNGVLMTHWNMERSSTSVVNPPRVYFWPRQFSVESPPKWPLRQKKYSGPSSLSKHSNQMKKPLRSQMLHNGAWQRTHSRKT